MTAPRLHEWCGMVDDPDEGRPCPCRAWADSHPAVSVPPKRAQSATLRAAILRARRTDQIAARARRAAA